MKDGQALGNLSELGKNLKHFFEDIKPSKDTLMRYSEINSRKSKLGLISAFALTVLVFSVTRGLVPILTKNASLATPTYFTAAILGVLLSCYGLNAALFTNSREIGKLLRTLLVINLLFFLVWLIPVVILRLEFNSISEIIYIGLFPFSIYALIKIPEKIIIPTLSFLTLVIAAFVILEFIELNTFLIPNGHSLAFERQALLRPGVFEAFGKTGYLFRPNGLFGSIPEDVGNILAILFVYWFGMVFIVKRYKLFFYGVAIVTLSALFFTSTASNISASLVGATLVLVTNVKNKNKNNLLFNSVISLAVLVILWWASNHYGLNLEIFWKWSFRASGEGDWENMLDFRAGDWLTDTYAYLFGHGATLNISRIATMEIGTVRWLFEYGLFHSLILFSILLYPVALFLSTKDRDGRLHALPYVAAVTVGVLSTWHYTSLIRTTNIFVFFALYAQALRIYRASS